MWTICSFEWRTALRQKTSYLFILLWVVVLLIIFSLLKNSPSVEGYTNVTGTAVNLLLYLLPLFMMISGSFAVASEMENGQWTLLSTYPLSAFSFVGGKLLGQLMAQSIILTLSYGASLVIGFLFQVSASVSWILSLYVFAFMLQFVFLMMGITIGSLSRNRWQALSLAVVLWFLFIMIWPTLLISFLNLVPYTIISPTLHVALFINPAELLRIVFVVKMGAASIFGQSYDVLMTFFAENSILPIAILYFIFTSAVSVCLSSLVLERRRSR